jgi:hypothetical protein
MLWVSLLCTPSDPACELTLVIVVGTFSGSETDGLLVANGVGFDSGTLETLEVSWRSVTGVDNGLNSAVGPSCCCAAKRVSNIAEMAYSQLVCQAKKKKKASNCFFTYPLYSLTPSGSPSSAHAGHAGH